LDRAAVPGLPVAETVALLPCIMASALVTGSRRTAVVDHAPLLQPYDGSSWTRCGHYYFMRKGQGRRCRRPDRRVFCSTSCRRRPGVRVGSFDRLCEMRLPELLCDGDSSATARRNNVHSVGYPECGARQLVSVVVFFFCRESGVQASRIRVDCVDGWIWIVRLVSSRLVSWRVVSFRFVGEAVS
jgi:hypothetical protein